MRISPETARKTVSKGTILLHKGEVCQCSYVILKGCLRSYVIDKAGKEHILQFAPEGWVIGDMDSFFNQKPTVMFIDAIEDTEMAILSMPDLRAMEDLEKADLVENTRKLARSLIANHKRVISLLSASAEDRYAEFLETYPALSQRLPLKYIASYLGMTPEYLSEVRRKITQK